MAFTTECIICNISIAKYMNSLSGCFKSESNSGPLKWNIRWILHEIKCFHRNSISDVPLSLDITLQMAGHY